MSNRAKNLDINQLAKRLVDESTGDEPIEVSPEDKKQSVIDKKKSDGFKGGKARASKLTAEQRSEIASFAASVRWHKVD